MCIQGVFVVVVVILLLLLLLPGWMDARECIEGKVDMHVCIYSIGGEGYCEMPEEM